MNKLTTCFMTILIILSVGVFAQNATQEEGLISLVLEKIDYIKGEIVNIKAMLSSNGTALYNETVDFSVDFVNIGQAQTDSMGVATLDWNTSLVDTGYYVVGVAGSGESTTELVQVTGDPSLPEGVSKMEECVDVPYEEEEIVRGTCTRDVEALFCDDEPTNTSCSFGTRQQSYDCVTSRQTVQKTRADCRTTAIIINDKIRISMDEYTCKAERSGSETTVVCDSKYDGNGDGICSSGESCQKYVVAGNSYSKYEKNSQDEFLEEDETFFAERASVEVLK